MALVSSALTLTVLIASGARFASDPSTDESGHAGLRASFAADEQVPPPPPAPVDCTAPFAWHSDIPLFDEVADIRLAAASSVLLPMEG